MGYPPLNNVIHAKHKSGKGEMNGLISIDWTNTLNTRKQVNAWISWVQVCFSIFVLVKRWQFLSDYCFLRPKYPEVSQKCPDMTLSGLLY